MKLYATRRSIAAGKMIQEILNGGESFILMGVSGSGKTLIGSKVPRYYLLNLLMVTIFIQPKI